MEYFYQTLGLSDNQDGRQNVQFTLLDILH